MSPTNRNLSHRLDGRLAAYATLAGVALAAPAVANAAIVYSGPISIPITADFDGLYINFVTGANAHGTVSGWDFNPFLSGGNLAFFASTSPANSSAIVSSAGVVTALSAGTLISVASSLGTGVLSTTGTVFRTTQNTAYIGIQFNKEPGGPLLYGWALLSTSATNGFPATLIGYAFEDTGLPILAGQVPEPSTVALFGVMAAGALGVRAWRKRKAA